MKMRKGCFWKIVLRVIILSFPLSANAGQSERWSCKGDDPGDDGDWVIAENRMFAVNGKGDYPVISNTATMAMAYELHQHSKKDPVASIVIVLDKAGGRMIQVDNIVAAGTDDASVEPDARKWVCRRVD